MGNVFFISVTGKIFSQGANKLPFIYGGTYSVSCKCIFLLCTFKIHLTVYFISIVYDDKYNMRTTKTIDGKILYFSKQS